MKETIKKSILGGVFFSLTVLIFGATYAAWVNLSTVSNGQTLTSSLMNDIINNQKDLDTRITGGTLIPSGAVMAFNLSSCPNMMDKSKLNG